MNNEKRIGVTRGCGKTYLYETQPVEETVYYYPPEDDPQEDVLRQIGEDALKEWR